MDYLKITPLHKPVNATVTIPGSKSYTNRALIMSALSERPVTIMNALLSDDTEAMIECLQKLGISVEINGTDIKVYNHSKHIKAGTYDLNARLSGTTLRFVLALLCVIPGTKTLQGLEGLNKRPIGELVTGLRQLGVPIEYLDKEGYPPIRVGTIHKLPQRNPIVKLNGDISSQYFTALMMIAPVVGDLTIEVIGNQISKSYIDMTIDMMKQWGVTVINEDYRRYIIPGNQKYNLLSYTVEGDFSGAGYFFAIAALTHSTFTLKNLNHDSKQGDLHFVKILERMGSKIIKGKNEMTIIGNGVTPIVVDMELCPDQAQTLAVLAAFADGKTVMTGVRSLRVKETERVQALQNELAKMQVKTASPDADTLIIYGGNPKPTAIDTYGDHRMAMSFAVAGTKLAVMTINNPEVVNKTFPTFWEKLSRINSNI